MKVTDIWVEKLPKEEQFRLWKKAKEGDSDALTKLLFSMKGLVISIAKVHGIFREADLEDVVQEAMLIVLEKLDNFDPSKNVKPSTYFGEYIRSAVQQWIAHNTSISCVPWYIRTGIAAAGAKPTRKSLLSTAESLHLKPRTLLNAAQVLAHPVYLDAQISLNEERSNSWEDVIICNGSANLEKMATRSIAKDMILEAVEEALNEREKFIISLRNGLDGKGYRARKEIAQEMNVSQERIRQIEMRALKKLKQYFEQNPKKLSLLKRAFN